MKVKHLVLDIKTRPQLLADASYLTAMLDRFPGVIGMTKLDEPKVYEVSDGEKSGVTGFVVIIESHISIHTWPEKGKAYIDVFSCKDFDTNQAIKFIEGYLKPYYVKITEIKRMVL